MVSTISETAKRSLSSKPLLQSLNDLGISLSTADGSKLDYIGYVECSIKIPCISRSFDIPLLVISDNKFNSACPVIIGTNVIRLFRDSQLSSDFSNAWQSAIDSLQCVTFSASFLVRNLIY